MTKAPGDSAYRDRLTDREQDIHDRAAAAVHYAGWLLDQVDATRRLSKIALAARLDGVGYLPWRTRQEARRITEQREHEPLRTGISGQPTRHP